MNAIAFSRYVRLLAHPLSLGAMGLMLANDFILKPLWPSWWTGKLSDFAGLFFLPFLAAALFSLVLPRGRPRLAGGLGFGVTALGFSLLKLDPAFNAGVLGAAHALSGLPFQARLDPSDLLALFSLVPAAWLWRRDGQPGAAAPSLNRRLLLVLPLAALVTLGDAAAPALGVAYLQAPASGSGPIQARISQFSELYQTEDGGLTWQALAKPGPNDFGSNPGPIDSFADPIHGTLYRFTLVGGIESSTDGGQTWRTEFAFNPLTEPEQAYQRLTHSGNIMFGSLPYAALVDPASGNLILAMGYDGVLVRRSSGTWAWVAVGPYRHNSLEQAGAGGLLLLLQSQLTLAILAGLGWLYTRSARLLAGRTAQVWTVLGWIGLGLASLLVTPELALDSYMGIVAFIGLLFMAFATLVALLAVVIRLKGRFFGMLPSGLPQALLLAAACLLPYVLWGLQVIPGYGLALALSTGLVVVLFVIFSLRPRGND